MRTKKLLAAFLLGVGLCFVPALGHGKIHPFYAEENPSFISERLLSARVDYIMCNPNTFSYVVFIYDFTGVLGVSLLEDPEGLINTKGKLLVHIYDTRDIFSHKSGMALLEQFKRELEIIYSYISSFASDMNTDIVAKFYNRKKIPLGYFYQEEYHLWEE